MSRTLGLKHVPVFIEDGDAKITTDYGYNLKDYPIEGQTGNHLAIDLVRTTDGENSKTASICAIADGIIYAQRKWVQGFNKNVSGGNCVYIRHNNGMISKYMHLAFGTVPAWIADNVEVKKGDMLGVMGSTGYAYGVHLHFQVEDPDGNRIDPEPYLTGELTIDDANEVIYIISRDLSDSEKIKIKEKFKGYNIRFMKEV